MPPEDDRSRLASAHEPLPEHVRETLRERINATVTKRDLHGVPIPRGDIGALGNDGFLSASLPLDVGGGGCSIAQWGRTLQDLGYASQDAGAPLLVSLFAGVAAAIAASNNRSLIDRYVRPLATGDALCAFAWTESADAFSFTSSVRHEEDMLVLSGEKSIVTGGALADAFMVYVRNTATGDLDVVMLDREDEGVRLEAVETMGIRTAGLARLVMEDVRVPTSRWLKRGDGLSHVQRFLNVRRVLLCCGPLGRMHAMLETVIDHLVGTERYGRRLADMHNVQASVGRMRVLLESASAVTSSALAALDGDDVDAFWSPESAVAKYCVTEQALEMGRLAMRVLGGRGYTHEGRIERDVRDFMGLIAGAGSQDILEVDIGMKTIASHERKGMKS